MVLRQTVQFKPVFDGDPRMVKKLVESCKTPWNMDAVLSGTTILHRAFLRAVDAELVVFEALPHAFWYDYHLPETKEELDIMAKFFGQKLEK